MSKLDPYSWVSPCDDPHYKPSDEDEWTQEDWDRWADGQGEYLSDCEEDEIEAEMHW